jgi:hypothetical protein
MTFVGGDSDHQTLFYFNIKGVVYSFVAEMLLASLVRCIPSDHSLQMGNGHYGTQ